MSMTRKKTVSKQKPTAVFYSIVCDDVAGLLKEKKVKDHDVSVILYSDLEECKRNADVDDAEYGDNQLIKITVERIGKVRRTVEVIDE